MFRNKGKSGITAFFENLICGNVYSKEADFVKFQVNRKKTCQLQCIVTHS